MDIKKVDFYKSGQLFSSNSINKSKNTSIEDSKKSFNIAKTLLKIQKKIMENFIDALRLNQGNKLQNRIPLYIYPTNK